MKLSRDHQSHTFANFVRGPSNDFACRAAFRLATEAEPSFNPLFIHGASSLGKTHLLLAIGDKLLETRPSARVVYASCEEFLHERADYADCDALLLDDVQFLDREQREHLQDELFRAFATLPEDKARVVLAADVPPTDMPRLTPRLREKFDWGMIAEVHPPDGALRRAIVAAKAEQRGLSLAPEVVEMVASLDQANVRALEGAVNTLATYAKYAGEAMTLEAARELLEVRLLASTKRIGVRDVQEAVAREYGLEMRDLLSATRHRRVTLPRQIAMYLAREYAKASLNDIAEAFRGKHHATVLYAVRKIEKALDEDADLRVRVDALSRRLGRG